jgi:hypothetical protein
MIIQERSKERKRDKDGERETRKGTAGKLVPTYMIIYFSEKCKFFLKN